MFPKVCDLQKETVTEPAGCRLSSCVWHFLFWVRLTGWGVGRGAPQGIGNRRANQGVPIGARKSPDLDFAAPEIGHLSGHLSRHLWGHLFVGHCLMSLGSSSRLQRECSSSGNTSILTTCRPYSQQTRSPTFCFFAMRTFLASLLAMCSCALEWRWG